MTIGIRATGRPQSQIERRGATALILAGLGNHWLLGVTPGISLALFLATVGIAANIVSARFSRKRAALSLGVLTLAQLPLIEATTALSVFVAIILTVIAALIAAGRLPWAPNGMLAALGRTGMGVFWRFPYDGMRWGRAARHLKREARGHPPSRFNWRVWVMPLGLTALFGILFTVANPVIEGWLDNLTLPPIDLGNILPRLIFSVLILMLVWPLLRPGTARSRAEKTRRTHAPSVFFGKDAILVALLLFNAVFALQTVLDLALLWSGAALPEGLSYAEYAHRGAYPLLATALLAAVFVLIALRPGSEAAASPLIRWLVYFWVGQNAVLVASSILRLDLYVDVYGLTPLRVAAFVWMGLIIAGLCLIVARIALQKSGEWLVGCNLAVLTVTLYASCFVDVTALMGRINLEVGATNERGVDIRALMDQGGYAVPYIDIKRAQLADMGVRLDWIEHWRRDWEASHRETMRNWRSWTRRDAALLAYLDAHPYRAHSSPDADMSTEATE